MKCLIDADTIAFSCAATAEGAELWIATSRADKMVESILNDVEATEHELWLSGPKNFRYSIYPEYKANRLDAYRPTWEREVKDHLVSKWGASWSDGCEADDMVGARQTEQTIIAHIDKDIDQIPGWHYNWELTRHGKVIRHARKYFVTPEEGLFHFYYQLLVGDPTDNIKGVKGVGPSKATRILLGCKSPEEYYQATLDQYGSEEELRMNADVLYIWQKENDKFQPPIRNS